MEWLPKVLFVLNLTAGAWQVISGVIIYGIFVVTKYKKGNEHDLLRLSMDGHITLTTGVMQAIAWQLIKNGNEWGIWLCMAASISMLSYMIIVGPFLRFFLSLIINLPLLIITILITTSR